MRTIVLLSCFIIGLSTPAFAQSTGPNQIYIYRVKSFHASLVKLKLNVNGKEVEMGNDSETLLPVVGDSITISVVNRRFSKHSSKVHQPAGSLNYFIVYPTLLTKPARDVWVIEPVCKECYEQSRLQGKGKQKT